MSHPHARRPMQVPTAVFCQPPLGTVSQEVQGCSRLLLPGSAPAVAPAWSRWAACCAMAHPQLTTEPNPNPCALAPIY